MAKLKLEVLEQVLVQQIISEAIQALEMPGVRVDNEEALNMLADAGASIDTADRVVHIPEHMVRNALETVPNDFYLYDLSGQPVIHYGGDDIHFDPGSTGVALLVDENGTQREPVTGDFIQFVKLVEVLPQIDAQSTAMVCGDVAKEIGDLYRLYLALKYMRKPIVTGAFGKETFWVMREMLVAVSGSSDQLQSKPIAIFDVCPSPPLLWSDLTCQNLIDCARSGTPAQLVSMPLSGATAPVTLTGAVVQHTAENLSGIVIHQLAKPGSPIVWGGSPAAFDMREGTTPMGAAETWLIDAAYVQVGKSLNLPTHVYMGMSDAKVIDAQCGLESMGGALVAAMVGANMISGAGMMDFETCLSCEKLIIDADIIGLSRRVVEGLTQRSDPIALDLIREMGHRADYLSHPDTRRWFRQELYMPSPVIDRGSYDGWVQKGKKNTYQRANERIDDLLKKYQGPKISSEVSRELHAIALSSAVRAGMAALPVTDE